MLVPVVLNGLRRRFLSRLPADLPERLVSAAFGASCMYILAIGLFCWSFLPSVKFNCWPMLLLQHGRVMCTGAPGPKSLQPVPGTHFWTVGPVADCAILGRVPF